MYDTVGKFNYAQKTEGSSVGHNSTLRDLMDLAVAVVAPFDDQSTFLLRELQRLRTRTSQIWPIPESIPDEADVVYCEYVPDLARRLPWLPGAARFALIVILPVCEPIQAVVLAHATPHAILSRPLSNNAIVSSLVLARSQFRYEQRLRAKIERLEENIRSMRTVERAKAIIMAAQGLPEDKAYAFIRKQAMDRRVATSTSRKWLAWAGVAVRDVGQLVPNARRAAVPTPVRGCVVPKIEQKADQQQHLLGCRRFGRDMHVVELSPRMRPTTYFNETRLCSSRVASVKAVVTGIGVGMQIPRQSLSNASEVRFVGPVHIDRTPQALPRSPMFARRVHPPIIALFWFCRFRAPEPAPAYHPRGSSPRRVHAGRSLRSAASSRQLSAPASPSLFLRQEAATAYREALKELTRERVPLQWATTQSNLGLALWRLGERESGTTGLEEAVAAFRDALMERTRERVPLDWAQTQNNLGAALAKLGERGSGTARLEEAVAAFRDALKERTRERVPLQWAMSFGNQGIAMMRLAERSGDATMAAAALRQIEAALETARAGEYAPLAAHFESHLMEARSIHDALKAL